MAITTRGGKQTIDPPMSSNEKKVIKDTEMVEVNGEVEDNTGKDAEMPKKVIPMPSTPPPFSQRLVKKTEDGKYCIL